MERMEERRFLAVAGIALFVCFIFIWGTWNLGQDSGMSALDTTGQKKQQIEKPISTASGNAVDIKALTDTLLKEVKYDTDLQQIDSVVARGMVETQEHSELTLYMGDGTYSDELLIVTSSTEAAAKQDQTAVEDHLKEMKKSFADYIPEQASKIEKAVIVRCGSYVIACVTEDAERAQEIIVKTFEQ